MAPRKQKRWNILAALAVFAATLLAVLALARIDAEPLLSRDTVRLSAAPHSLAAAGPGSWRPLRGEPPSAAELAEDQLALSRASHRVRVGVYATTTYDLDLSVPSYAANGYLWMRWEEPLQRLLEEKGVGIDQRINLVNGLVSDAEPILHPVSEAPERMEDGSYYQIFTFMARFQIDRPNFRRYPFASVSLPMVLEADDVDGTLDYANLRFIPDVESSGIGLDAGIIGWRNQDWSIAEYRYRYATDFGFGGGDADYSRVVFDVTVGTSAWAAFWRLLLPLAVVMAMVLLVFKVRPDEQDARASIPVTVLLTLVFLQQTYRAELPQLPYLTFLDQVYVIAFVVTLLAFVLVLWNGRRYGQLEEMPAGIERDRLESRLYRLDELWPLLVVLFTSVAVLVCWLSLP
jgi:hypothetical protein